MKKDLKITFGGHYILYGKSNHDGGSEYHLYGQGYDYDVPCLECGSTERMDKGSYEKCLGCAERITMDWLADKLLEEVRKIKGL